uniref:Heparan-alpha-glucosaminide N-acetyltransferase n=1 Tax=Rhizophora mucronata TaxID=61149 RepID=A0A2P2M3V2_RHIMU
MVLTLKGYAGLAFCREYLLGTLLQPYVRFGFHIEDQGKQICSRVIFGIGAWHLPCQRYTWGCCMVYMFQIGSLRCPTQFLCFP